MLRGMIYLFAAVAMLLEPAVAAQPAKTVAEAMTYECPGAGRL